MRTARRTLPAFLFFALLRTGTPAFAQPPAPLPIPPLESAGALGSELFLQSGATGLVLVVVRDHQVYFRGYGETAPGSRLPPDDNSLVRLCSLTKIFTTDVLAKLVADGTVRLDDPLQHFAPARTLVPKRIKAITLADLATHTSGLPRELGTAPRGTPHFTFPDARTRWRWLPNQHLRTTPGTAALYSNIGFDFLSDALQSATHKQYAALLAERTLNPLHMRDTTFFPNLAQCGRLLVGVHDEGACISTEETAGSSGLYSTPVDMALWLGYLLGATAPGDPSPALDAQNVYLLPSQLVSQQGLDHAGEPTGIGLGWIHLLPPDDPSHLIEKTGGGAGFSTYIAINHTRRTALFLAATDGAIDSHVNLFKAANDLLLNLSGLPPLPPEPPKPIRKRPRRHRTR